MATARVPTFYPTRINMRVPSMAMAADVVDKNGVHIMRVEFDAPAAAATGAVGTLTAGTGVTTHANSGVLPYTFAERYGRHPTLGGTTSSNTGVATLVGYDYLNQRVALAMTGAGSASATAAKALKVLETVVHSGHAGGPVSIGWSDRLGLPYKTMMLRQSIMNGLTAGAHTLVAPDTAAQSLASSDPRGSITLSTAANGTRTFAAEVSVDPTELHGLAHAAT